MFARIADKIYKWNGDFYTWRAKRYQGSYGDHLRVNKNCSSGGNVFVGNMLTFNNVDFKGSGRVAIDDYFHSGFGCLIEILGRNYEGRRIPYAHTFKSIIFLSKTLLGLAIVYLFVVILQLERMRL